MKKFWDTIKNIGLDMQEGSKKKGYSLLFLIFLGIILMLAGTVSSSLKRIPGSSADRNDLDAVETAPPGYEKYESELGNSLQDVLEHIDGISHVQVFIHFTSGEENHLALNREESTRRTIETDREGGSREIYEDSHREEHVVLRESGGGEHPVVLREDPPTVKGVLVVASGAESSANRLKIVRAIQSVLDLPVHRIAVLEHEKGK